MARPVQLHLTHAEAAAVVVALGEAWADTQHPHTVHGEKYARRLARTVRRLNGAIKAARVNQIRDDWEDAMSIADARKAVMAVIGADPDRALALLDSDTPARPADFKDRP